MTIEKLKIFYYISNINYLLYNINYISKQNDKKLKNHVFLKSLFLFNIIQFFSGHPIVIVSVSNSPRQLVEIEARCAKTRVPFACSSHTHIHTHDWLVSLWKRKYLAREEQLAKL